MGMWFFVGKYFPMHHATSGRREAILRFSAPQKPKALISTLLFDVAMAGYIKS